MSYLKTEATVVIDANLAVRALLPIGADHELDWIIKWRQHKMKLAAPALWLFEAVSVIRRTVYLKVITTEEGRRAVQDLFALGVETVPADTDLCRTAFTWAERLGQSKAYDGFYLATAERMSAEKKRSVTFWTADERLANRAAQLGVAWVRWTGKK